MLKDLAVLMMHISFPVGTSPAKADFASQVTLKFKPAVMMSTSTLVGGPKSSMITAAPEEHGVISVINLGELQPFQPAGT